MPRAALREESIPRLAPATPEVTAAVAAWVAVRDDGSWSLGALMRRREAWSRLEDLLLAEPMVRHVVGDTVWGVAKTSKRGFEVITRPYEPTGR
jgi:hypothetical protein